MNTENIVPTKEELRAILQNNNLQELKDFCESSHPAVIAESISKLELKEALSFLEKANAIDRSMIFSHLDSDLQIEMIERMPRTSVTRLFVDMPPDDRADLFKQLPETLSEILLPALAQAEREDIRRLISYEEGTAGAKMTSDYATLLPELTASLAIERLREIAPNKETIYYAYVLNNQRMLIGFVSLKDLILAQRNSLVSDIMHSDVIFARVTDDQEEAARKIQKYDLLALPILNNEDSLVGIITHDDAIDIITQEHTEDIEKLMAITGSHENAAYIKTPALVHLKNRAPWVMILAILGLVSGFIVQSFDGLLLQITILAAFMPMLADTGGNTGSQASSLIVRALALKEVFPKDIFRILFKELKISFFLALLLSTITFTRVVFFSGNSRLPPNSSLTLIALAISLALGVHVITATLIGALLPLGAAKMKLDPAIVASPALTTIVDITGLLIYFTTVKLILGL